MYQDARAQLIYERFRAAAPSVNGLPFDWEACEHQWDDGTVRVLFAGRVIAIFHVSKVVGSDAPIIEYEWLAPHVIYRNLDDAHAAMMKFNPFLARSINPGPYGEQR